MYYICLFYPLRGGKKSNTVYIKHCVCPPKILRLDASKEMSFSDHGLLIIVWNVVIALIANYWLPAHNTSILPTLQFVRAQAGTGTGLNPLPSVSVLHERLPSQYAVRKTNTQGTRSTQHDKIGAAVLTRVCSAAANTEIENPWRASNRRIRPSNQPRVPA